MEPIITEQLLQMGASLSELAVKGTATKITNKIKVLKEEKSAEKIKNIYDEIVNELLSERDEAIRIAQSYKFELEKIVISDEDIEHLNATATRLLDLIKTFSPEMDTKSLEAIKDLISVDTLKTMQLLGFNYKAAIGEPLTQLCSSAIASLGKKTQNNNKSKH